MRQQGLELLWAHFGRPVRTLRGPHLPCRPGHLRVLHSRRLRGGRSLSLGYRLGRGTLASGGVLSLAVIRELNRCLAWGLGRPHPIRSFHRPRGDLRGRLLGRNGAPPLHWHSPLGRQNDCFLGLRLRLLHATLCHHFGCRNRRLGLRRGGTRYSLCRRRLLRRRLLLPGGHHRRRGGLLLGGGRGLLPLGRRLLGGRLLGRQGRGAEVGGGIEALSRSRGRCVRRGGLVCILVAMVHACRLHRGHTRRFVPRPRPQLDTQTLVHLLVLVELRVSIIFNVSVNRVLDVHDILNGQLIVFQSAQDDLQALGVVLVALNPRLQLHRLLNVRVFWFLCLSQLQREHFHLTIKLFRLYF
mmetsp:Transcript_15098/g.42954  ORF Transcript_15098/g.42954 Transcript_15098/m.42954 type:complete len:355 (+) Transcript_15098:1015-2079(+)